MTTRTTFVWMIAGALTLAGMQRGDAARAATGGAEPGSPSGASTRVLRIDGRDKITSLHLAELQRGSATARDLLDRVANLPSTILILRAEPLFFSQTHLYGRSQFWIHSGELFGYIRYQGRSLHNFSTQCLIVHELAHALEIATVDRRAGTLGLQSFVLSRAFGDALPDSRGVETEFPQQLALAVLRELVGKAPIENTLEELAAAHHIVLPEMTVASAWSSESKGSH